MDEDLHDIEDLFRDGLEDNEEMPSVRAWNGIDNILNKDNVVSIRKKYTALKRMALLLLLLLLGLSIYEINRRQNNHAVAKRSNNQSNTETANNTNNNNINHPEIISPDNKQPQNQNDSISLHKDNNENIVGGNSVPGKNTYHNNPPFKHGNSITDENKTALNHASSSGRNNNMVNSTTDNLISNTAHRRKNRLKISDNTIANNHPALKNKQNTGNKSSYAVRTVDPKPFKSDHQPIVTNDGNKPVQQLQLSRRLNSVAVDKINTQMKDSIHTKKTLQFLAAFEIPTPLTTKNAIASNVAKKAGKLSRFSIIPFFSTDVAWYRLQEGKPDNQPGNLADIEKNEKHDFSSTVGVLVDYNLNNRLSLQSGLTYSNINITLQPETIYAQPDNSGNIKFRINTSSGYGYVLPSFSSSPSIGDSLYAFTSSHTLQYASIPLTVKYNITKGRISFNALAGISANFLTISKIESLVEKGVNNEIEVVNNLQGLKKVYFSGLTGLGIDYRLNRIMSVYFAPTFKFALNSINQNAPVKSYPNSFGTALGLKIKL